MPHENNSHVPNQPQEKIGFTTDNTENLALPSNDWSYATQDLLETLPKAWTQGLLYFLTGFVAIALPWSMLYKVEETGTAHGRIEPKGETIKVETPISGKVSTVLVSEGDTVEVGDVLMELDAKPIRFDLQQAQTQLEGLRDRLSQQQLLKQQVELVIRTQRLQSQTQISEQQTKIDKTRQQFRSLSQLASLEKTRMSRAQNNVKRYQKLWQQGAISKLKLEQVQGQRDERNKIFKQLKADIQQASFQLDNEKKAYERVVRTGKLTVLDSEQQLQELESQIAELQTEIVQSHSEIESLKYQLQQRTITAQREGKIFQLPITKPGAVVQPDQLVAEIAPQGDQLILRAKIATSESGFIEEGMDVKLKFDAYPYQDYGVVEGKLIEKSPTSTTARTAQGISTFEVEIKLMQECIQPQGSCIPFVPGDTATAQIIVRERRVIDFVIDPFKKLAEGGVQL